MWPCNQQPVILTDHELHCNSATCRATCEAVNPSADLLCTTHLQVPSDQDLADLLSALSEADTAAPGGLYAAALPPAPAPSPPAAEAEAEPAVAPSPPQADAGSAAQGVGKVAAVCRAVRAALKRRYQVGAQLRGRGACWPPLVPRFREAIALCFWNALGLEAAPPDRRSFLWVPLDP